jgi:hypothetical protein
LLQSFWITNAAAKFSKQKNYDCDLIGEHLGVRTGTGEEEKLDVGPPHQDNTKAPGHRGTSISALLYLYGVSRDSIARVAKALL